MVGEMMFENRKNGSMNVENETHGDAKHHHTRIYQILSNFVLFLPRQQSLKAVSAYRGNSEGSIP